jgi:ATP-dependent 26S proteasome regulatory subunit
MIDEKPDVDYADIGGLDLQKQEIREAVELPLTHFGKFSILKTNSLHSLFLRIIQTNRY